MRERSRGLRTPQSSGECSHGAGQKNRGEKEQRRDCWKKLAERSARKERAARGIQRVRDRVEAREELQPSGKDGDGEEHAAGETGYSQHKPLSGIAALEKK